MTEVTRRSLLAASLGAGAFALGAAALGDPVAAEAAPASASSAPSPAFRGPSPRARYAWSNVQIHGGGFVPGIIYNPTEQGLVYARTDIGGAYRLDRGTGRWISPSTMRSAGPTGTVWGC